MLLKDNYLEQIKLGIKCTNSYGSVTEVMSRLCKSDVLIDNQLYGLLFIQNTRYDFWRLYFYIQDISQIKWFYFRNVPLVAEIVVRTSKENFWSNTIQTIENKGDFKVSTIFKRLFRGKIEMDVSFVDFSSIETAQFKDLRVIQHLLEENFDLYSSRIPSLDELESMSDTIFLIKENNQIAAIFITQKKGNTLEFRYWLVLEKYRGKKYGGLLMKRVLTFDPKIERFVSWININLDYCIEEHKRQGFKEDGLTNYVLYRK